VEMSKDEGQVPIDINYSVYAYKGNC
jgi:hypothetical protein